MAFPTPGQVANAAAILGLLASAVCQAAQEQFWPELNGYFKVNDGTRVFLMGSLTRAEDADDRGSEPRYETGKLGAHVDFSLKPLLRPGLDDKDWERNRYLWIRLGYMYVGNYEADGETYHEDRGIFELSARQPVAHGITLTSRLKWDMRDVRGEDSNRYRVRVGLERPYAAGGHALVPYAHAEAYYDSRYDDWNRQRYQAGVEIAINDSWRIEPYFARQDDSRSEPAHVNALGLIFKYYH